MSETNIDNSDLTGLTFEKVLYICQENARQSREDYQRLQKLIEESARISEERLQKLIEESARITEERLQKLMEESARITDERFQKMEESARISEERFQKFMDESARISEEYSQKMEESRKISEERSQKLENQFAETKELFRQTDEQMKRTEELFKQTTEQIKRTDAELGRLGNRFGEMIEHLVTAGVADRFNELNYHFHGVYAGGFKVKDETGQTIAEIDVVLENDDYIIAVEVKAKPRMDDISDHIERLKVLKQYFGKHREKRKKVIGALAGAVFAEHIKKAVIDNGLYPIVQSGDTIKIDIPKNFQPQLF